MERDDVVERLHGIAARVTRLDVRRDAAANGSTPPPGGDLTVLYGLSSLQAFEFLLAVEEGFGVTFSASDLARKDLFVADTLAACIVGQHGGRAADVE